MLASSLKFVKAFDRLDDEDLHYQTYFKEDENEQKGIGPPHFEDWENAKSALFNSGGGGGGGVEIPTFCDLESDDISVFDLSIAFSETVENQENLICRNKVEKYLLEPVERERSNFDILTWWSVSSAHYPILALIAKDVFAMSISTVASESAFSCGGRVLDPFRSSLTPKMVKCLICTQNWLQAKYHRSQLEEEVMLAQNVDSSLENLQLIEDAETVETTHKFKVQALVKQEEEAMLICIDLLYPPGSGIAKDFFEVKGFFD
ncbi:hypothetical protein Ddye_028566 [Dipteronia dyeriana]|uniref:HAT C-terminal dimerisation domain-containing protein n=1 Tax=Dipteronia dyeriana TaxID=168575 RepID=A0AAD9TCT4_9ROSI|nr:hypothetical protein Ddye_028566 [Dipteronia dyeriana]